MAGMRALRVSPLRTEDRGLAYHVCVCGGGQHMESCGSIWLAHCLTPRDRTHKVLRSFQSGVGVLFE